MSARALASQGTATNRGPPVAAPPSAQSAITKRWPIAGASVADVAGAGLDQTAFVGEHHKLGAVTQAELGEDARHVRLDGRRADEELAGDLGVARPAGDGHHHLALPVGEALEAAGDGG